MDNSDSHNQTPALDPPFFYSSVLSQSSTPLTNLNPLLIASSTPLLRVSSETSLTNHSTHSFDATNYPQSSQTVYTQRSLGSIPCNEDGILREEQQEPNQAKNLTPLFIASSTPLLRVSSETSLTNSTPSFDATVYPQSSQTVYTQSSQSSITYNSDGIVQLEEEHHEPNLQTEDHELTPSSTLGISNTVASTSATFPTSNQTPLADSEKRVYNVVKTTPPAKKCKPDLKTDEAKELLKSNVVAITSRCKKKLVSQRRHI